MSLNRLLTRIAVVSALNNHMAAPWPTLAGPNIFDSKIEPVEDLAQDRAFPCCVVYTDYDLNAWAKAQGGFKDRKLTITLELLIVQGRKLEGAEGYQLEVPTTDSEIESSLDIFEVQIYRALGQNNPAANLFNYFCTGYDTVISRRGASIEGGQRLAARQITMEMKSIRDPVTGTIPAQVEDFLTKLEDDDDFRDRIAGIREMLTQPANLPPTERMMQAFGWSEDLAKRLGHEAGTQVLMPANLTFNINGVNVDA